MLWTLRTRRLVQLAGIALVFASLLQLIYRRRTDTTTLDVVHEALRSPAGADSLYYMRLGEHAFQQYGSGLYRQLFFAEHQKFIYPPSSLFLIEALDRLPHALVSPEHLWKALMIGGWLGSILLGVLLFRQQSGGRASVVELVAVAVLGVLFLPFAEAFLRGQVQILLTLLWGLSALLYAKGKAGWAGAVLALTCAFKPQLGIFLLWGVLRREWRLTASFLITGTAIVVASLARFGVQTHFDYLAVLSFLSRHGEALLANQSALGVLDRVLRNGDALTWSSTAYPPYRVGIFLGSTLFSVACLLVGLLLPRRTGWSRTTRDYLFFGCLSVLMSPIAWEHHFGYFFFLFVAIAASLDRLSMAARVMTSGAFLCMANRLPMLDGFSGGFPSLLGDYMFWSALLALGLVAAQAHARHGLYSVTSVTPLRNNDAERAPQGFVPAVT